MSYERMTKKGGFTESIDLTREMGYSHIYNRLSVLEDKLESGELLEPPFALGDEAWILDGEDIFRIVVDDVRYGNSRWTVRGYHHGEYCEFIADDAFRTKREADERLKELKRNGKAD